MSKHNLYLSNYLPYVFIYINVCYNFNKISDIETFGAFKLIKPTFKPVFKPFKLAGVLKHIFYILHKIILFKARFESNH